MFGRKLTELNPRWVGYGGEGITDINGNPVPRRDKVAIQFDCPCGSKVCTPAIISFSNPPDGKGPVDNRVNWEMKGSTFEDLTLSPSIQRMDNCKAHFHITNGEITQ